jgi:hypothetical protein
MYLGTPLLGFSELIATVNMKLRDLQPNDIGTDEYGSYLSILLLQNDQLNPAISSAIAFPCYYRF